MEAKVIPQISTRAASLEVSEVLKRAIMGGFFRPGEPLTIRGLAEQLGTSPMPVREAIKTLVAARAIEVTEDRKHRIPVLSKAQIHEILELRMLLEGRAAAQAAERISDEELKQLQELYMDLGKAFRNQDVEQLLAGDVQFHFRIYQSARNNPLLAIIESLWLQYAPIIAESLPRLIARLTAQGRDEYYDSSYQSYGRVISALRQHDPDEARNAMMDDLRMFIDAAERINDVSEVRQEKRRAIIDYENLFSE
jgi:DNA-binding GntR family transcriptional regulator